MAQKCLECLVVDGNYSKARIAALFLGLISLAFFIWLIVLTVKFGKNEDAGTRAPQDFEWNKIAVTCSDDGGNKIDTQSKATLEECKQWAGDTNKAKFIFYSDENSTAPADCSMYMKCGEKERRIVNKPGLTFQKNENDKWKKYNMTCGKDLISYQIVAMVDSLEKCKEEASKSDHGKFIFFPNYPVANTNKTACKFYDMCDSTHVLTSKSSGETYQRKIKEE